MEDCVFCRIVRGEARGYIIAEDDEHLALLDRFPNKVGQALAITRRHVGSYAFAMDDAAYTRLLLFGKRVGRLLDGALGAHRTCLIIEGMEIDHVHLKLYPLTAIRRAVATEVVQDLTYDGYLTTRHGPRATDEVLAALAAAVRAYAHRTAVQE
ncbi:MAG: diadenosine tetraphosphate hydrolase [Chloroflexi bacterium]|nr:diadenosine tetraphosphate hydrolase [Chloroflexota bacterium]